MKYKHKPTVVDAIECWGEGILYQGDTSMPYRNGDYRVTGIAGEEYIVKKTIFEKIYEKEIVKSKIFRCRHKGTGDIITSKYYEEFQVYLTISQDVHDVISTKEFELTYERIKDE